jgi:hypothetical protein
MLMWHSFGGKIAEVDLNLTSSLAVTKTKLGTN